MSTIIQRKMIDQRDILRELVYDYPETKKLVDLDNDYATSTMGPSTTDLSQMATPGDASKF